MNRSLFFTSFLHRVQSKPLPSHVLYLRHGTCPGALADHRQHATALAFRTTAPRTRPQHRTYNRHVYARSKLHIAPAPHPSSAATAIHTHTHTHTHVLTTKRREHPAGPPSSSSYILTFARLIVFDRWLTPLVLCLFLTLLPNMYCTQPRRVSERSCISPLPFSITCAHPVA